MNSNVVDATERFGQRARERPVPLKPIDILKGTKTVPIADRPILATHLGKLAAQIDPARPRSPAKRWFDLAWQGDRWEKRKRYICFPGESPTDFRSEGAYVAKGTDWAALIEQAAIMQCPGEGDTVERERHRVHRNLLRGTSYLPEPEAGPLEEIDAQGLIVEWTRKIAARIEENTLLERLWEALKATPFDVMSYRREPSEYSGYEGDDYSHGPLGAVAERAMEISRFRYSDDPNDLYRFEPIKFQREEDWTYAKFGSSRGELDWAYPTLRLGLRGHSRRGRIFAVPNDFMLDLPPLYHEDDEEYLKSPDDRVMDWLIAKGLMTGKPYEKLPAIEFDVEKGYGWTNFSYELVESVWLDVRPKPDGSPGLWVRSWLSDLSRLYPLDSGIDTLALEASSLPGPLDFLPMHIDSNDRYDSPYEFLGWPDDARWGSPSRRDMFKIGGKLPPRARTGLIEIEWEEIPGVDGWVDDIDNIEVQNLLFRNPIRVRFCPSVATDDLMPPPCRSGTIAATLITNAACEIQERIGSLLQTQAAALASAGLAFHGSIVGYHKGVIDAM